MRKMPERKERQEMSDSDERQQQILDAAAAVIIRLGYDKTTMSDIAGEAGVSRRTIYLYFQGKEELFEELLYREYMQYAQTWLEQIEADPRGGTFGGFYRATFHAVNRHPLIAAMLRRDGRVIGNYLRKRNNLFSQMLSQVNTLAFFQALQAAGAIRQDIDAAVIEHIVEMLAYGQLTIGDFKAPDQSPPYEAVMEALSDMMDRALRPEDGASGTGASREAGKAISRQITAAARAQLEQIKQVKDMKESLRNGAALDNR
jgi:AcrR family transcriptional regulator